MSSSKSLIINCGASHVAAAVFTSSNGQLKLDELVTRELAYDLASEEAWLPALGGALREISRTNAKIRGKATFIIPGYQLLTKPIKVPHVEAAKQTQIIAFEAQNNLPFPMAEAVWGSQVIADDGVETEVILIAQKAEQANRFCGFMAAQGFEVTCLEAASLLDYNSYRLVHGNEETDTLLVNIGARSTNLTFISPAGFFVRNINLGGNTLTQSLADTIGKPFLQAEQVKIAFYSGQTSFDADDPAVAPIQQKAQDFMKRLGQEITRSIVTYRRASTRAAPQRLLLTGRGALLPGLSEFLAESQKVAVDYLNPTPGVIADAKVSGTVNQIYYQLSEVIGEASRLTRKDAAGVNLLPPLIRKRQLFRKKIPVLLAAAAALALAPAPILFQYFQSAKIANQQGAELKKQLNQIQALSTKIQQATEQANLVHDRIGQFEGLMNSRSNWILFFSDLQNVLGNVKDVWLDSLDVVRTQPPRPRVSAPKSGDGPPVEAPLPPPTYDLNVSGRMLLREFNQANPTAFNKASTDQRLRDLLNNFKKNPFVKSIPQNDFVPNYNADPRMVGFKFTIVIDPNKPL